MPRLTPDDPSATLADLGGLLRISSPLINRREPPPRPLQVRPVFRPPRGGTRTPPEDRLLAGLIHQAGRLIKAGGGGEPAAAPRIVLINLSFAD